MVPLANIFIHCCDTKMPSVYAFVNAIFPQHTLPGKINILQHTITHT